VTSLGVTEFEDFCVYDLSQDFRFKTKILIFVLEAPPDEGFVLEDIITIGYFILNLY